MSRPVARIASELDQYVEKHQDFFEETAAYMNWANEIPIETERRQAKVEWYHKNYRLMKHRDDLLKELKYAQKIEGAKNPHPLETNEHEFPEELAYLDSMYSDPGHFFFISDKEKALANRIRNDDMAARRDRELAIRKAIKQGRTGRRK